MALLGGARLLLKLLAWVLILCYGIRKTAAIDRPNPGYITIDCGSDEEDATSGSQTDAPFIDTGINSRISSQYVVNGPILEAYKTLRSFPGAEGDRNCYTLKPSGGRNIKYLIRARFMYGNYDGKNNIPLFKLYIGVNFWSQVDLSSLDKKFFTEIIYKPTGDSIYVCLENIGQGTPFISELALRPLNSTSPIYNSDDSVSSLFTSIRYVTGSISVSDQDAYLSDQDDIYDRYWSILPSTFSWQTFNMSTEIEIRGNDAYKIPSDVYEKGARPIPGSRSMYLHHQPDAGTQYYYMYWHFAETQKLSKDEVREFNISMNGNLQLGPIRPKYLEPLTVASGAVSLGSADTLIWFTISQTNVSTLPPFLNAFELYRVLPLPQLPTNQDDVDAITDAKTKYKLKVTGWQGDPCLPVSPWDGLNCTTDDNGITRITYLDLASKGLTGEILPSLSSLSSLTYLNLSHNALTGEIPEFLAELPSLQTLDLSGNTLNGAVPKALSDKVKSGYLSLRLEDNPDLCTSEACSEKNNKHKILVVVVAASASILIVLIGVALLCFYKRKGNTGLGIITKTDAGLKSKSRRFTYSEIVSITKNFQTLIGKGGFGNVYLGWLPDATEVAVKILTKSTALSRELFKTEAELLTRVHHRNLVTLVGYCDERDTMALVCDFMTCGDLQKHLSGAKSDTASWKERLQIAVDAAQGLDYLHSGCKPAIVHRDMKPANILLDDKMQAKIADFGMSRIFASESATHISTSNVAGTHGYVDPEYHVTYRLNEKSDVYSFGVILLELITGRRAISMAEGNVHITNWVTPLLERGEIDKIVDARFRGDFNMNSAWKALETAMSCVHSAGNQRPNMGQVLSELKESLALEMAHDAAKETAYEEPRAPLSQSLDAIYVDSEVISGPTAR